MPVPAAVEHLAGLQAQTPHTWYVGLWNRLVDLDPDAVGALLVERRLVRIALMRSTIHLVTAADAIGMRPLVEPVIVRSTSGNFGKHLVGVDLDALVAAGREILIEEPVIWSELGRRLATRFPGGTRRRWRRRSGLTWRSSRCRRAACGAGAACPSTRRSTTGSAG